MKNLLVFIPAFDVQLREVFSRNGLHEPLCQLDVSYQGDAEIDRLAADHVVVGQLLLLVILGDIDHEIYLSLPQKFHGVRDCILKRPV